MYLGTSFVHPRNKPLEEEVFLKSLNAPASCGLR